MRTHIVLLAALGSVPLLAQSQVVLNASAWVPATHALSLAQKDWCDAIDKETKGGIKCNILPKAVAAPLGTFDAVRDGLADISFSVDGYTPGRFVFTQLGEFPFAGKDAEATSAAYQKIYTKYFAPLGEHRGVRVLGVYSNPGHELMSSGVLDGTFITVEAIKSLSLTPVKFATLVPGGAFNTTQAFIMNPAKYSALSAEHKAAVDKLSGDYAARLFARGYDKADAVGLEFIKATNIPIVNASPAFVAEMKAKLHPVEAKWIEAAEGRGLNITKAVLDEFRAEAAKAN